MISLERGGAAPDDLPMAPAGVGELREASSAAQLASWVGLYSGVLTLVLSIWKAEIRFLMLEGMKVRLSHSDAQARI
jgi:hypothetical protein